MSPLPIPPRRALRTTDAARYLGISPSLLRKMRLRGPADPLGSGPAYIRLSPSLIVYEISALDAWLDARSLRADTAA
jgi:predicted DNA-binding transcriptional regulator AlpA